MYLLAHLVDIALLYAFQLIIIVLHICALIGVVGTDVPMSGASRPSPNVRYTPRPWVRQEYTTAWVEESLKLFL